ncbi:MAG: hypothetical protein WC547_01145 [Candidatus Omnitrophota bacterium]
MFNSYKRENSVCFGCTRRSHSCHTRCPDGIAEAERNESDRQFRLQAVRAAYDNGLQRAALNRIVSARTGGRV